MSSELKLENDYDQDNHGLWFALDNDGTLYNLGDHGDYDAAMDTADSLGLDAVWLFDEQDARYLVNFIQDEFIQREIQQQVFK